MESGGFLARVTSLEALEHDGDGPEMTLVGCHRGEADVEWPCERGSEPELGSLVRVTVEVVA